MSINYRRGEKQYAVKTPVRKQAVKRIVRRRYTAFASSVVRSDVTCNQILTEIARKVKQEMKNFSSDATASLLTDTYEALKCFSWETVHLEMRRSIPTLMSLLSAIVPCSDQKEPLLCMLAAQLLKSRHQRMSLVQRAVSLMLYGSGTRKQVSYTSCNITFMHVIILIGVCELAKAQYLPFSPRNAQYCWQNV